MNSDQNDPIRFNFNPFLKSQKIGVFYMFIKSIKLLILSNEKG